MATAALVLCNPLCFLFSRYNRLPLKVLKSALIDFYDPVAISNAKRQLLEDMKSANFSEKLPHVPERRGGETHTVNEVEDIFVLIAFLDERKLVSNLPLYVSDNPDNLPSSRLYEGDMKILLSLLEKISDKLTAHGSAIAAIVDDLHSLRCKPVDSVSTANVHYSWTHQGVNNSRPTDSLPSSLCAGNVVRSSTSTLVKPIQGNSLVPST